MKKKFLKVAVTFLFAGAIFLTSCGSKTNDAGSGSGSATTGTKEFKVGIALATGGKGDKSFNDSAIAGLEKAKKDLGIVYKVAEPKDATQAETALEGFAEDGYDLVIAVSFSSAGALQNAAENYPDTKFAIIDFAYSDGNPDNVKSIVFKEEEGSYLAGVLAAKSSKANIIGFIGGQEVPLIGKFQAGYEAGAKEANPDIKILSSYIGTESSAFNDPARAKEIALDMISQGADVIYHAAGNSGNGMFEAVKEKNILGIGVDSNQNYIVPGNVIGSMLKAVNNSVYITIQETMDGNYKGGEIVSYGLKEDGIGLTDLETLTVEETEGISSEDQAKIKALKETITTETKDLIKSLKEKIISGEIKVPTEVK